MGLFSGETIVTVATQVQRVIKDSLVPNALQTGVINSVIQGGDIVDYVLESVASSIAIRADQMYRYAEQHYPYGLPSASVKTAIEGREAVIAVLQALEGGSSAPAVTLDYSHYGPANRLHMAWLQLIALYGYNPVTNQLPALSTLKGSTVYLHDMQLVLSQETLDQFQMGSLDQWGTAAKSGPAPWRPAFNGPARDYVKHTLPLVIEGTTTPFMRVTYAWNTTSGGMVGYVTETLDMPFPAFEATADYFQVRYVVGGVPKYWMYQVGSGTYPTLDAVFATAHDAEMGQYFPWLYFRFNKHSDATDATTPAYLASKKMAKLLGMDYQSVAESINENPDIGDVLQGMLVMAVPADTTNAVEQRYLFDFFDSMYDSGGSNLSSRLQAEISASLNPLYGANYNRNTIIIQDQRFKMALSNSGLYKRRVTGSIGAIGSYSSVTSQVMLPFSVTTQSEAGEIVEEQLKPVTQHIYRHQVSLNQYDEIEVVGLQLLYYVTDRYLVAAGAPETASILLVPIDRSITEHYPAREREALYSRSMHFVFNSMILTKLAWYETDLFQLVIIGVAMVITFYSIGESSGWLAAVVNASGTAATNAAIMALLTNILKAVLVSYALKLFVKAVGWKVAFVVAILAMAYGAYDASQFGGIKGAPWAEQLLQVSSGLTKAITADIQAGMKDLAGEASNFSQWASNQTKLLESAQELLEHHSLLSPLTVMGETPDELYNRTVHSGNIGAMGIEAISSYVDVALTLPRLNDTLGESYA